MTDSWIERGPPTWHKGLKPPLRIRDDGRGLDPEILDQGGRPGHFGLQGMRERAQKMGGRLELWSRREAGTEVELNVPAATAYRGLRTKPKPSWFRRSAGRF